LHRSNDEGCLESDKWRMLLLNKNTF
jgi:hypothetical protein